MKNLHIFIFAKYLLTISLVVLCVVGFNINLKPLPKETHYRGTGTALVIASKEDAVKLLMKKFSVSELIRFKKIARMKGYSEEIELALKSRLSPKEYEAIKTFILTELNVSKFRVKIEGGTIPLQSSEKG